MAETTEIVEAAPILPDELSEPDFPVVKTLRDWNALEPAQKKLLSETVRHRQRVAFLLRAEGLSLNEISKLLGITPGHIVNDIRIHVRKLTNAGVVDPEAERHAQLWRLDQMLMKYFQMALDGDMDAANVYLALENRRSKLLGLDQPIKMKIAHNHKKAPEINRREVAKALTDIADRMEAAGKTLPPHLAQAREMYRKSMQNGETIEGKVVGRE